MVTGMVYFLGFGASGLGGGNVGSLLVIIMPHRAFGLETQALNDCSNNTRVSCGLDPASAP